MVRARGQYNETPILVGAVRRQFYLFPYLYLTPFVCKLPFLLWRHSMVEANPSLADRVVPALHKFVSLANSMLHSGQGLEDWTNTRWEDFVITLQW